MALGRSQIFELTAGWLAPGGDPGGLDGLPTESWIAVIDASSHHFVTPALAWYLRDAEAVPAPVRDFLGATLALNRERNRKLLSALLEIGGVLNAASIKPQLIKGAGLLFSDFYRDPGMRVVGDLDLLVREDELEKARRLLEAQGYVAIDDPLDRPDRHQLPMMVHETSGIGVELHRHPITRALAPLADSGGLLARGADVSHGGVTFAIPAPADRIVLAIAHGQIKDGGHRHGVPPLRAMLDLALHRHLPVDWADIDRRFDAAGRRALLHDTLALSAGLMGMEPPMSLLDSSRDAMERMRRVLDRSGAGKTAAAIGSLLQSLPSVLTRHPLEQLTALSPKRWRQRMVRHRPRW